MGALTKVLTLVVFVRAQRISGLDMTDGGNRQEHAALCSVFAMAGRKLDIPMIDPLAEDDYKYIQELNFTVAPETWQKKFYKEADRTTVHGDANAASLQNVGEERHWPDWKEAAQAFRKESKESRVKELLEPPLTSTARVIAAVEVAAIAASAWTIKQDYPVLTAEQKAYAATNPPPDLAKALFGGGATTAETVTANDPFGKSVGSTARDQICDVGHANSGIKCATAMLACVCEPHNAQATTNGECTEKAKPVGNWNGGVSGPSQADMQKLAKSCGTPPSTKLTRTEIRASVTHLRSLIHFDTNDGYLGHYSGTGCNGSKGHGICVKFTNLMTSDKTQFETKTWVAKFVQAAEIMDSLQQTAAKAAAVNAQLKNMKV
uniref:Variant surface glycoprotein 1522 n=1 Tax=Trypanosoma brucei TaxID=5691 RepID=M4SVL4_9TRYP|nr:variant surface glycoprotein 1522 [Trypanosoma brucei]